MPMQITAPPLNPTLIFNGDILNGNFEDIAIPTGVYSHVEFFCNGTSATAALQFYFPNSGAECTMMKAGFARVFNWNNPVSTSAIAQTYDASPAAATAYSGMQEDTLRLNATEDWHVRAYAYQL